MKKKNIAIANWKMNGLLVESMQLIKELRQNLTTKLVGCEIVICPPFTLLRDMAEKIPGTGIKMGGQNCSHEQSGAYTGEISAKMLRDMTCDYVILGHSERRQHNNEGSELVKKKAASAIEARLKAVICVGETLYERDNDLTKIVIREQLLHSIPQNANDNNIIIAYEPVWAIGTGKVASAQIAQDMHRHIRLQLAEFDEDVASHVGILYGGSVNDLLSIFFY